MVRCGLPLDSIDPSDEVEPRAGVAVEEIPNESSAIEVSPANRTVPDTKAPIDDNLTEQQRLRDEYTTNLYKQFVDAHKEKQLFVKKSKESIRSWCIAWVTLLILACICLSAFVLIGTERQATDVIALISSAVPLVAAVIGTLNIVTKHVFPENEEQYITDIVKAINENDLKNKQQNLMGPEKH
jgi:hypothetical protein